LDRCGPQRTAAGADFGQMATAQLNAGVEIVPALPARTCRLPLIFWAKGGKAGKFELRDNGCQELRSLAHAFCGAAVMRVKTGLKRLTAALQDRANGNGTSGEAANIVHGCGLTKLNSSHCVEQHQKQFGVDLRNEMKKAKAAGEDTLRGGLIRFRKKLF